MSTKRRVPSAEVRAHDDVLGYLVKHVQLLLEQRTDAALAPFGVNARDLGVLRVIAAGRSSSQQDVAGVLGVDRTSMVALLDALEARGLVSRAPSESDRRRNVVVLTASGRGLFQSAEAAAVDAESAFVAALGSTGAARLRRSLRVLLEPETSRR